MDTGTSNLFLSTIAKAEPWLFILGAIMVLVAAFAVLVWLTKSLRSRVIVIVLGLILLGFHIWGWAWSATHVLVGPREQAFFVYHDGTVGRPMGRGMHPKPLFGVTLQTFPGQEIYQWCPEFTPGIAGGVEIKMIYCMRIDARRIDWSRQFQAWNKGAEEIQEEWRRDLSGIVASTVAGKTPSDLLLTRDAVAGEIATATQGWFEAEGIPVSHQRIQNWDFTNPEVKAQYDAQGVEALRMDAVVAAQQTAVKQRELEKYLADTYDEVLAKRAATDKAAMDTLGLPPEMTVPYLLGMRQLAWLEAFEQEANLVVTLGGTGLPYTFGETPKVDTGSESTP